MPRRPKPVEVRIVLVPTPADYEARAERVFKAYVKLLARAALRTRCYGCGGCDADRAGRAVPGEVVMCDECKTSDSRPGRVNEVEKKRIRETRTSSKEGGAAA